MKILFNRKPKEEPYGGGNQFLNELVDYLKIKNHNVVFDLQDDIDILFVMDPRADNISNISINDMIKYRYSSPKTKILHRVNECDARKNTNFIDEILLQTMNVSDSVVFISKWLQDYFRSSGFNKNSSVIYNGCNLQLFNPEKDKNINKKIKLVTHHWSDNWMKGFDIYTEIDKYLNNANNFEFTYIGRYNSSYSPKNTNIISPLYGKKLGDELKKYDVYVTASRFEPCGMHHIEAAASGLPVLYHRDSGGINECAKKHGEEFYNFKSFLINLNTISNNIKAYRSRIDYNQLSIENVCHDFENILNRMHNK